MRWRARKNKTKPIQHNLSRDILINTSKSPINTSAWIIAIYKNNTSRLWLASARTISPCSIVFDASVFVSLYSLTGRVSFLCAPGNLPLRCDDLPHLSRCIKHTLGISCCRTSVRWCVCMQKSLLVLG